MRGASASTLLPGRCHVLSVGTIPQEDPWRRHSSPAGSHEHREGCSGGLTRTRATPAKVASPLPRRGQRRQAQGRTKSPLNPPLPKGDTRNLVKRLEGRKVGRSSIGRSKGSLLSPQHSDLSPSVAWGTESASPFEKGGLRGICLIAQEQLPQQC